MTKPIQATVCNPNAKTTPGEQNLKTLAWAIRVIS